MLNRLQKDILFRHVGPFFFVFLVLMFLLLMQFLIMYIDRIVGKGLELTVIVELIVYQLAYMVVLAVPMSVLVTCLMTFGRFSELNEFTAIKAAGVTPLQLMKPVLIVALLLSVFMVWFSNSVLPEANFKAKSLFLDIRMKKPGFDLKANTFYDGLDGYTFLVRDMSAQADTMFDVTIYQDATAQRDQAIIKAETGILSADEHSYRLRLDLYKGSVFRFLPDAKGGLNRVEESLFEQYRIRFDLSDMEFSRTNPDLRRRDDRTMSSQAMQAVNDSLRKEIADDIGNLYFSHRGVRLVFEGPDSTRFSPVWNVFGFNDPDSVEHSGAVQSLPPDTDTKLVVLQHLKFLESQRNAAYTADIELRSFQSSVKNVVTNTQWRVERIAQYEVEIIKKVAIPVGCIIFVLIGTPLGMLTRKGNLGFNAVVSTVLFTYYWITIIQGEKLADRLIISPFWGMWFGNITLGILGIVLLIKVTTEKRLSDLWRS